MTYYLRLATFLLASLLVAGCGGGGGSGGNSGGASPSPNTPTNPNTSERTFSAMVTKGPVDNASCELFELTSAGARGSSLGTAVSVNGMVEFSTSHNGEAIIECTGGTYTDEATGETLDSPSLRSAITVENSRENAYTVSPLTELAVQLAENDGDLGLAIESLNEEVAGVFGLDYDITTTTPTDIENADLTDSDEGAYASLLALFSQLDADSSETIGELIASVADDLADGTISASLANRMSTAYGGLLTSDTNISSRLNESLINRLISTAGLPAPNHKPVFSSVTEISIPENSSELEYNARATDSDGDTLSYSISGDDSGLFSIDSSTGALNIVSAPDYESPEDLDANNQYNITLVADDNKGGIAQMGLSVLVTDQTQLAVQVTYPTPNANLGGEATQTTVAGYVTDEEDGEILTGDIESLTVNNVVATFDLQNPSRWRTTVPVNNAPNKTVLDIRANGRSDYSTQKVIELGNNLLLADPREIVIDSANNRAIVTSSVLNQILFIDLDTGERSILSDNGIDSEIEFNSPYGIALDTLNNRVFVINNDPPKALMAVNLTTGVRTLISGEGTGEGIDFFQPSGIALDSDNNRVLVADYGTVFSVDLETGNRTDFSANPSPDLNFTYGIVIDSNNERALITAQEAVYAIDLETGARTIFSDESTGTGPNLSEPVGITLDSENNRALVADAMLDALVAIDLLTGDRAMLSDDNLGQGEILVAPQGVAFDANNNRAFINDHSRDYIFSVDLETGDRSVFSENTIGSGVKLNGATFDIKYDEIQNQLLITDFFAVIRINLETGERSYLSYAYPSAPENKAGEGPDFLLPKGVFIDNNNNRAMVIDTGLNTIFSVNMATGDRTIISGPDRGSGVDFYQPSEILLINDSSQAIVAQLSEIPLLVDLNTGDRSYLSAINIDFPYFAEGLSETGDENLILVAISQDERLYSINTITGDVLLIYEDTESDPTGLTSVAYDQLNNRALKLSYNDDDDGHIALIAIDILTGEATVLSDNIQGSGTRFQGPEGIAVDSINSRAFLTDEYLETIFVVDLITGERAITSQK